MARRKVLVIGNYQLDRQQSMLRFAHLLQDIYHNDAVVKLVYPSPVFGSLAVLPLAVRKYLAYIDKLLIFPIWLLFSVHSYDRIHIADHSNAFYAFFCPRGRCLVTCHDLLAVRAAFGDSAAACDPSPIGIWLQRLIMAGLGRADAIAFVSQATFRDFQRLIRFPPRQRHAVIPNPLNAPFTPDLDAFPISSSENALIPPQPFLLMVGSALPRKNRGLALRLLEQLGPDSPYRLVFAGAPLTEAEQTFHATHPLGKRLISIPRPGHGLLNRLYGLAHALVFPSFSEGFGWPLLEAQTCHCPVIASTTTSIPEVAGTGALFADPSDAAGFASHVHALEDPTVRARLIDHGQANTRRYDAELIGASYRRFAFQP
jgi:glycosyltransferase involved in cell wall biosynthesis